MILYNDQLIGREQALVDIEDRGYQFGDGIYEVIRVYEGKCFLGEEHFVRLERSAASISLELPYSIQQLRDYLHQLIEKNDLKEGMIYLQVTRGRAPRSHPFPEKSIPVLTAYTKELRRPLNDMREGVKALLVEDMRWLRCDIKSLNLLGNVLAKQQAKENGCTEAIFHRGEIVTEGSSTNVFGVFNGEIITHPTTNLILPGITRQKVLEIARTEGYTIYEKPMTVHKLLEMDEVFITSTTIEVTPVIQINNQKVGEGAPGPVTQHLQQLFNECIQKS